MHLPRCHLSGLAIGVMMALPSVCLAQHSWCNSGAPMVRGASDPATNRVVDYVCDQQITEYCCAPDGRWSLGCVERGAAYAKVIHGADPCGRYYWDQGALPGSKTHFPRDFNLVALSGYLTDLKHVGGAVAAATYITAGYFRLNHDRPENVALVARVGAHLWDGELFGGAHYGEYFVSERVTFMDYAAPTNPSLPIDFPTAEMNLGYMSEMLWNNYDSQPAQKVYSTLRFVGSDPELNVFSVTPEQLANTYSYEYSVPEGASVIVNVGGTAPVIQWAGFSGTFTPSKTLWNFPQATSLLIQGVGFRGSILAPLAHATLRWGSVRGTAVVASASADAEFYHEPYQVPSPGGCLDFDLTWSCSADTMTDATGKARDVAAEAGFLQIPSEDYVAENHNRTSPTHRIWYSFHPAKVYPKWKPLAVFFNGGPGSSTSRWLFSFNTGPNTLDPDRTGSIIPNANANWTDFANLLYIDAPSTGFSYAVASGGVQVDLGTDMDRDAGIFLSVVLRFLDRHPALQNNPVILVAESYGGARSILMLRHLFEYASLTDPASAYQDSQLSSDVLGYFGDVFQTPAPTTEQIAEKFGRQVLIDPVVAGAEQYDRTDLFPISPGDCHDDVDDGHGHMVPCWSASLGIGATCSMKDCDQARTFASDRGYAVSLKLTQIGILQAALGVNPRTIEWMHASARTTAYGRGDGLTPEETPEMWEEFEDLGTDDSYFVPFSGAAFASYGEGTTDVARRWNSPLAGYKSTIAFVNNDLRGVQTFITVGRYDAEVFSPRIVPAINGFVAAYPDFAAVVSGSDYRLDTPTEIPSPGAMWLFYTPLVETRTSEFNFPTYAAGHTVTLRAAAAAQFKTDVQQWFISTF
ncbi:MAG: choice-of-anchor A family protein [Polyangiaceae bacterium]|nr:choice-of-anchor A family protein [Polyangiaceae bacterium]